MDKQLGILFLHHKVSDVVINNLASIQKRNHGVSVVTISAGERLPGGYLLDGTPEIKKLHTMDPRRSSDRLVCSWFLQRKEKRKKWWVVEWDTFTRVSVRDYYAPVWHFPFVSSSVKYRYQSPDWWWFRSVGKMPESYYPYAMGASPFLYLISDKALTAICKMLIEDPLFAGNGELRFATAAHRCGFTPCGYSPPNDQITWIGWKTVSDKATIFHPVKSLVSQ